MATLQIPLSALNNWNATSSAEPPRDCFLQRKHHCPSAYSRIENWLQDVEEYTFPTELVSLSLSQANAILKYRDETKLRSMVRDQKRGESPGNGGGDLVPGLEDPLFLDEMHAFIMKDWQEDDTKDWKEVREWHASLIQLQEALHEAIQRMDKGHGTFVKLSIRSPKDASLNMTKTYDGIRARVKASTLRLAGGTSTPKTVNEDVVILKEACAASLCVRDSEHAMRLLLESDRVHTDLCSSILYKEEGESFTLKVAVREWNPVVDSDWEFRLFVVANEPTALTIYNDFFYDLRIVEKKGVIERMILETWGKVRARIHQQTSSYCIDFAVTPDLQQVFIIEVNNFLPPLAGTGLFCFSNDLDRKLLDEGPFTFRVREAPLCSHEQEVEGVGVRTLHPPLLALLKAERLRKEQDACPRGCVVS